MEAWEGLEKPLGTFRAETFVECGEKCSSLSGCGMIHYNRHDNRGYKWCTPAKVHTWTWSLFHWQFLDWSAISKPLLFAWISQLLYLQIACIQPEYQIRKMRCGYGPVPCPGDIFVFMFTEIPLCESVFIIFCTSVLLIKTFKKLLWNWNLYS